MYNNDLVEKKKLFDIDFWFWGMIYTGFAKNKCLNIIIYYLRRLGYYNGSMIILRGDAMESGIRIFLI